jgi:hypothetical protein
MDFTRLTGEEIIVTSRKRTEDIMREYNNIAKKLEEEKEQKRKEMEEFQKEIGLPYKEYLPEGKYIFIF